MFTLPYFQHTSRSSPPPPILSAVCSGKKRSPFLAVVTHGGGYRIEIKEGCVAPCLPSALLQLPPLVGQTHLTLPVDSSTTIAFEGTKENKSEQTPTYTSAKVILFRCLHCISTQKS